MIAQPFPWFGGKRQAAHLVWQAFGEIRNYVEPFFGGGAVLLNREPPFGTETVNDLDGLVANFWRSAQRDPDVVARFADWPVNEADLHARELWLLDRLPTLELKLAADWDYFDAEMAGYWVHGISIYIGSGYADGTGAWTKGDDGLLTRRNAGRGINRQLPHLGNAGMGINRQRPHLGDAGRGEYIKQMMRELSERLRDVRVCCGDWSRVCGPSVCEKHGVTGLFLDPPYFSESRDGELYRREAADGMREAIVSTVLERVSSGLVRCIVCGYSGEYPELEAAGWSVVAWKASGGYSSQNYAGNANRHLERLWLSPQCLPVDGEYVSGEPARIAAHRQRLLFA